MRRRRWSTWARPHPAKTRDCCISGRRRCTHAWRRWRATATSRSLTLAAPGAAASASSRDQRPFQGLLPLHRDRSHCTAPSQSRVSLPGGGRSSSLAIVSAFCPLITPAQLIGEVLRALINRASTAAALAALGCKRTHTSSHDAYDPQPFLAPLLLLLLLLSSSGWRRRWPGHRRQRRQQHLERCELQQGWAAAGRGRWWRMAA